MSVEAAAKLYLSYRREGMDFGVVGAYERVKWKMGEETPSWEAIEKWLEEPATAKTSQAYCATCRAYFTPLSTPPFSVIHVVEDKTHLCPLTREVLKPLDGNK